MSKINNQITKEKIDRYIDITRQALEKCRPALDEKRLHDAKDFLDMAERYYSDALHFLGKGDVVLAFAAVNYAHGWLDSGARIGLFKVKDSKLFTVDD